MPNLNAEGPRAATRRARNIRAMVMKILVADDDPTNRQLLQILLRNWGYESLEVARDGNEAWQALQRADPPGLAILDWMMPGLDGLELCRKLRAGHRPNVPYLILLTARSSSEDMVSAFEAGFDDFICKPFDHRELRARVNVGFRIINLQKTLANRLIELEHALAQIKELQEGEKLRAIGRLAAGVAHEINTPIQYVWSNVNFLQGAFNDLKPVLDAYGRLPASDAQSGSAPASEVKDLVFDPVLDLDYLREEIPRAIEQSLDGVMRVTKIVKAIRELSHPGQEKIPVDVNKAIENCLMVCGNEWKYVAEMVTVLSPTLPKVPCVPGEFNQVILNLVINAAHAIADVVGRESGKKGVITIRTFQEGRDAVILVQDTGTGIPEKARPKIFEHFFTTKPVGKGTGQGLAIAHAVIVNRHGGTITFETEAGKGTTFMVKLPLEAPKAVVRNEVPQEESSLS